MTNTSLSIGIKKTASWTLSQSLALDSNVNLDLLKQLNIVEEICCYLCCCCFKKMDFMETQFPLDNNLKRIFNDLTDLKLRSCTQATSFCVNCFNQIQDFNDFRKISIAKQQKFEEIIEDGGDLCDISALKLEILNLHENETKTFKQERISNTLSSNDDDWLPSRAAETDDDFFPETIKLKPRKQNKLKKEMDQKGNFECEQCSFISVYERTMVRHTKTFHSDQPVNKKKKKKQVCPFCGKLLTGCISTHIMLVHDKVRKFFCDLCDFSSLKRSAMEIHMWKRHMPVTVKCKLCTFQTKTACLLKSHVKNLHDSNRQKDNVCHICNRAFYKKSYLQEHISRIHKKEKNVSCEICNRRFFNKECLR